MSEGVGVYKKSKVAADRAVERMIAEGLPAVIVLPSTPIGPRDIKPTPTGRIVIEAVAGPHPGLHRHRPGTWPTSMTWRRVTCSPWSAAKPARGTSWGPGRLLARTSGRDRRATGRKAPDDLACRARPSILRPGAPKSWRASPVENPSSPGTLSTWPPTGCSSPPPKPRTSLAIAARPYSEALADALAWFRAAGWRQGDLEPDRRVRRPWSPGRGCSACAAASGYAWSVTIATSLPSRRRGHRWSPLSRPETKPT